MVEFNKIAMYVKLCTNGSKYESTDCNEASQEELINVLILIMLKVASYPFTNYQQLADITIKLQTSLSMAQQKLEE